MIKVLYNLHYITPKPRTWHDWYFSSKEEAESFLASLPNAEYSRITRFEAVCIDNQWYMIDPIKLNEDYQKIVSYT